MKKLICLIVIYGILSSCVYAAPYRQDYFNTSNFHISAINKLVHKYNLSSDDNNVNNTNTNTTPVMPDKTDEVINSEVTQPKKHKTMADVVGSICVITSVSRTIYNEEKVTKLTYYVNNNVNENYCYLTDDSEKYAGTFDDEYIRPGSLVYLNVNTKGIAKMYSVVGYIDSQTKLPVIDESVVADTHNSNKIDTVFSYLVRDYYSGKNTILELGNGETIVATKDAKLYTVDINRKNTDVISGDCLAGEIYKAIYDQEQNKTEVFPVVAVIYDDEAVFVCSYTTPLYVDGDVTDNR